MNRILHIGISDNPGGVENVIMNYYRVINKHNFQFDFLDIYDKQIAFTEQIELLGGQIYNTVNYKKNPLKSYKQTRYLISKNKYKCIHVHMQSAINLLHIYAGLHEKVKVIAHSHSSSVIDRFDKKILHCLNVRILRTLPIEKFACGINSGIFMWGSNFNCENIIRNATSLQRFGYNENIRSNIRNKIGFNDCFVIGFVGKFSREKNTVFLIDILEELIKLDKRIRLLTVGGSGLFDEFEKLIYERGLGKYYYSAGIQDDTSEWYQVFDAFLMPSFFEGFPMVAVEAQAAGLPCFLSNRISNEINITGNVKFLAIDNRLYVKDWVQEILKSRAHSRRDVSVLISEYDVNNAVLHLENIYSKLCK